MTDTWQTVASKRGNFGNGAFGGRRSTAVRTSSALAIDAKQQKSGSYIPPAQRVHEESFDEAFPQLGGAPVRAKLVAPVEGKTLMSDMVAELAMKEAVAKEVAATQKRRADANQGEYAALQLPNISTYLRKVALRKAEKERREYQEDLEFLASHYTLFRGEAALLYKAKEQEQGQEEEEDYDDYEYASDAGSEEYYDEE
jgi:hypothetical protein